MKSGIRLILTCPGTVTVHNRYRLQELVENGPASYPGARFVLKDSGERIDLKYRRSNVPLQLEYGWIERRLKLRHQIDNLNISRDVIKQVYRFKHDEEINTEIQQLLLAEEYLAEYINEPFAYDKITKRWSLKTGIVFFSKS